MPQTAANHRGWSAPNWIVCGPLHKWSPFRFANRLSPPRDYSLGRSPGPPSLCAPETAFKLVERTPVLQASTQAPRGDRREHHQALPRCTRHSAAVAVQRAVGEYTPSPRWSCHLLHNLSCHPSSTSSFGSRNRRCGVRCLSPNRSTAGL